MANEPVYRVTLTLDDNVPVYKDETQAVVEASFRCMFELLADNGVVARA